MTRTAHNRLDLVGGGFGQLRVLSIADGRGARGELLWRCRCDCGAEVVLTTGKLRTGHTTSCGCKKRRRGAANPNHDPRPLAVRLAERVKVNPATGCHEWRRRKKGHGYGMIRLEGKIVLAHRAAWIVKHGSIPADLDCLHRCDNPACCNPDHLFLGTQADNNADRDRKGRQVAPKGENHGCAILTEGDVREIRSLATGTAAAKRYGISVSHACKIRNGSAWGHLR